MTHSRFLDPRYLLAAVLALGLGTVIYACSGGDEGPGEEGKGGTGGAGPGVEVCDNALDDDEDGKIDCLDPDCEDTEICCPGGLCRTQCGVNGQADCQAKLSGSINMVCSPENVCEHAGQVDEEGHIRRGEALIWSQMAEVSAMHYQGEQLMVLSSDRPGTDEKVTCDKIMYRQLDPTDPKQVNVVHETAVKVSAKQDVINAPAFGVPVPKEGQKLIAVMRFFSAAPDAYGEPRGDIVGEGCAEFDTIPEGSYDSDQDNPARNWEIKIRLFCGGYLNRECPEPKTCVVGLCRDTRCGTCGPNYVCREWNGEPDCRKACNPDQPDCPNLHRCDATAGEVTACVPAQ